MFLHRCQISLLYPASGAYGMWTERGHRYTTMFIKVSSTQLLLLFKLLHRSHSTILLIYIFRASSQMFTAPAMRVDDSLVSRDSVYALCGNPSGLYPYTTRDCLCDPPDSHCELCGHLSPLRDIRMDDHTPVGCW